MKDLLDQVYKQRNDYIIIGLTGKTGSGCTSVSNILSTDRDKLNFPDTTYAENVDDDLRKREIITKHFKNNWFPFTQIAVRDVITTFILEHSFNDLKEFLVDKPNVVKHIKNIEKQYDLFKASNDTYLSNISTKTNYEDVYNYIIRDLPEFSSKIKDGLGGENYRDFSKAFQLFGNNIRKTGCALGKGNIEPKNIYSIAERINFTIKLIKKYFNDSGSRKNYFVIDAFRNPFEALFFKERYSAFYLLAVKSPEEDRLDRLFHTLQLTSSQISEQDKKEDPGAPYKSHDVFASQNIPACIQKADIHINNKGKSTNIDLNDLKFQIIRYISLIQRPGIITPQRDEKLMQIAFTAKLNSGCISRQVGAVVTNSEGAIVAIGWNDVPKGQTQCLLRNMEHLLTHVDKKAYSKYEQNESDVLAVMRGNVDKVKSCECGRNMSFCYKSLHNKVKNEVPGSKSIQPRALHAEENAFLQIVKHGGQGIVGGTLYCTASPCELCSKKAYQLEIPRVVYVEPYPDIAISHIIESGTNSPEVELFAGAIGPAYHKLYEAILPYKDELDVLINSAGSFVGTPSPHPTPQEPAHLGS